MKQSFEWKKIGAEAILTVIVFPTLLAIVLPFSIWIASSIYELRADYSDIKALNEKIEGLKISQDKTNTKIDHLTDYLISKGR